MRGRNLEVFAFRARLHLCIRQAFAAMVSRQLEPPGVRPHRMDRVRKLAQGAIISDIAIYQMVCLGLFMLFCVLALKVRAVKGVEIVYGDNFDAVLEQFIDQMAAYKPCATGD